MKLNKKELKQLEELLHDIEKDLYNNEPIIHIKLISHFLIEFEIKYNLLSIKTSDKRLIFQKQIKVFKKRELFNFIKQVIEI
jgi:hypothetical protein